MKNKPVSHCGAAFAGILCGFRQRAGYSSARNFYKAVGGRDALDCTYTQYLNIEAGRSTPKPALVRRIMAHLELKGDDARTKELLTAYLKALLKDDEFIELVLQTLSGRSHPSAAEDAPLRQALKKNEALRQVLLTREQMAVIESDDITQLCSQVFCNDSGEWGTLELSSLLGCGAKDVHRSLEKLRKAGLITPTPAGRYRSSTLDKVLVYPRSELHVPENLEVWRRRLEARRGRFEMYQSLVLRASSKGLRQYYPYLSQSVAGADLYAVPERGEDTGLYVVEGMVRKLFDF